MGSLFDISESLAQVIVDQMIDVCDLMDVRMALDAQGALVPDLINSPVVLNIPCSYEPFHRLVFQELQESGVLSSSITHKVLMKITVDTIKIKANYTITVRPRGLRPAYVFEKPQRMDESLSPLLIVGAALRNQ